ncbi:head GIN domain-containing protein [Massilia sp. TS11]|uniref:head GIN domain-containing protein n=1 Tax=Massilia sp. TS11 TaxID=2908003 RepID=UPI001EDB869E|nr:head GIN domain-containing protein [Massilia sp. TS11]MCG2584405.1 DUF2807 domain-containing protein [Massilia sp. TS11]
MHIRIHLSALAFSAAALALLVPASPALASGSSWSWGGERVQGNGNIKTQKRDTPHFTGVASALSGNVDVRIGASESIQIETDENLLPLIETVVENGVLKIRPTKKNLNLETRSMKIVVNAKEVERLSLGGAGNLDADAVRGTRVKVDLGGSGAIHLRAAEAEDLAVVIGGSGNVKIDGGTASKLSVTIGGSGDLNAGNLKARDVSINIGGSGQATVWASDSLNLTVAGSGDVNYYGDPRVSKSVLGSGGAKRLGPAPR